MATKSKKQKSLRRRIVNRLFGSRTSKLLTFLVVFGIAGLITLWVAHAASYVQVIYLKNSNAGGTADIRFSYGNAGSDTLLACDWNGDGKDTIGAYRGNTFYLRNSNTTGNSETTFVYGNSGDKPVCGDWDGDKTSTIGVYRGNTFYLRSSNTAGNAFINRAFGDPGDVPVVGDWDGNGTSDIGVFRPSNSTFYLATSLLNPAAATTAVRYGDPGDVPVVGDWDGNGTWTVGVYRPSTLSFYMRNSNTAGAADISAKFGNGTGDHPIAGDWDGNKTMTVGVWRTEDVTTPGITQIDCFGDGKTYRSSWSDCQKVYAYVNEIKRQQDEAAKKAAEEAFYRAAAAAAAAQAQAAAQQRSSGTQCPQIQQGASGGCVELASTKLWELGFGGGRTSYFDSGMKNRVCQFQSGQGNLSVDGIIGSNTWPRLLGVGEANIGYGCPGSGGGSGGGVSVSSGGGSGGSTGYNCAGSIVASKQACDDFFNAVGAGGGSLNWGGCGFGSCGGNSSVANNYMSSCIQWYRSSGGRYQSRPLVGNNWTLDACRNSFVTWRNDKFYEWDDVYYMHHFQWDGKNFDN